MFGTEITTFVLIGAISLFTALTAVGLLSLIGRFDRPRPRSLLGAPSDAPAFLFDGHLLVEATPAGHAWLEEAAPNGDPLSTLIERLAPRLPDLAERLQTLMNFQSPFAVRDSNATSELDVRGAIENGLVRIDVQQTPVAVDTLTLSLGDWRATMAELAVLRRMAERLPVLVWRQAADGRVDWANDAYRSMAESLGQAADAAPGGLPPRLFPAPAPLSAVDQAAPRRLSLSHRSEPRNWWFECYTYPAENGATLHFAIHANPLVRAEEALRNFVQTLTQTFAHLPIGLAIFDRQRQLALFNPALSDLTRLEPDWLTARPTLYAVLDRLRDRRMMPEPKDYKNWREQMADLERAAENGTYEEVWPLPTGQTYRITGRPHPEGAVAFLLEDISAEVSLKRRFRAELELSQSVIDNLGEAIAVFAPSGQMVLSNAAYAGLWGHDPSTTLGEIGITDATRHWRQKTRPTPVWGDVRDFATQTTARAEWTAEVQMTDGRRIFCRFSPLARSASLCAFTVESGAPRSTGPERMPAEEATG